MLANRKAELIFGLAILMACGVPAASMAHPIDLYPKLGGFALREPEMPTQPGAPQIYSTTNNAPNWLISQWKIAGPKLSAFTTQQEGDSSVYEANAPTASVRIVEMCIRDRDEAVSRSRSGHALCKVDRARAGRQCGVWLEADARRELHDPRPRPLGGLYCVDASECLRSHIHIRRRKIRVVEEIRRLDARLQFRSLGQGDRLNQGHRNRFGSRTNDAANAGGAKASDGATGCLLYTSRCV